MTKKESVILYRPFGREELALIRPVLIEASAVQIACDWNVAASGAGYVARCEMLSFFPSTCEVQNAGAVADQECSTPAASSPAFKAAISDQFEMNAAFHGLEPT